MMYFRDYRDIIYKFGNEDYSVGFQDLSTYVDVIDEVKSNSSFYLTTHIPEGYRPDQFSYRLYGTPLYYWTFFLLNDTLRESGWPLSNEELMEKAKHDYPNQVINVRGSFEFRLNGRVIDSMFLPGRTVTDGTASGVVVHRNLDLGQIVVKKTTAADFTAGNNLTGIVGTRTEDDSILIHSVDVSEFNAAHHYIDGNKNLVDIDPTSTTGAANLTEVTIMEELSTQNELLREIRVLTESSIGQIVSAYKQAVRSTI